MEVRGFHYPLANHDLRSELNSVMPSAEEAN
jgi:hypothetical protein